MRNKIIVYELDMIIKSSDGEIKKVMQFTTLKEIHIFIGDIIENNMDVVKMTVLRLEQK